MDDGDSIKLAMKSLSEAPTPSVFEEIDEPNAWLEHDLV